ncbi:hypothetical protein N9X60_00395 [Paracoccaceae bacterium]|nr:hypothetical protein [Paracoccaceae bacterium]
MKRKNVTTMLSASLASLFIGSAALASGIDLEEYGRPAIISFHADSADVTTTASGQQVTFEGVSVLATLTSDVHLHNSRIFTAFPTSELPEAWNSCNAMKFENSLFHSDGVNSVVTFASAPADHNEHGHVAAAPLVTQTEAVRSTLGGDEGILHVMLVDAEYASGSLSFSVSVPLRSKAVTDGEYQNVVVATECIFAGLY